jgi:hypothetical protein
MRRVLCVLGEGAHKQTPVHALSAIAVSETKKSERVRAVAFVAVESERTQNTNHQVKLNLWTIFVYAASALPWMVSQYQPPSLKFKPSSRYRYQQKYRRKGGCPKRTHMQQCMHRYSALQRSARRQRNTHRHNTQANRTRTRTIYTHTHTHNLHTHPLPHTHNLHAHTHTLAQSLSHTHAHTG